MPSSTYLSMLHHYLTLQIRHPFPDENPHELRRRRHLIAEMIVDAEDREAQAVNCA